MTGDGGARPHPGHCERRGFPWAPGLSTHRLLLPEGPVRPPGPQAARLPRRLPAPQAAPSRREPKGSSILLGNASPAVSLGRPLLGATLSRKPSWISPLTPCAVPPRFLSTRLRSSPGRDRVSCPNWSWAAGWARLWSGPAVVSAGAGPRAGPGRGLGRAWRACRTCLRLRPEEGAAASGPGCAARCPRPVGRLRPWGAGMPGDGAGGWVLPLLFI